MMNLRKSEKITLKNERNLTRSDSKYESRKTMKLQQHTRANHLNWGQQKYTSGRRKYQRVRMYAAGYSLYVHEYDTKGSWRLKRTGCGLCYVRTAFTTCTRTPTHMRNAVSIYLHS